MPNNRWKACPRQKQIEVAHIMWAAPHDDVDWMNWTPKTLTVPRISLKHTVTFTSCLLYNYCHCRHLGRWDLLLLVLKMSYTVNEFMCCLHQNDFSLAPSHSSRLYFIGDLAEWHDISFCWPIMWLEMWYITEKTKQNMYPTKGHVSTYPYIHNTRLLIQFSFGGHFSISGCWMDTFHRVVKHLRYSVVQISRTHTNNNNMAVNVNYYKYFYSCVSGGETAALPRL